MSERGERTGQRGERTLQRSERRGQRGPSLLGDAVAVLDERGVLDRLGRLIQQVYRRAADRHEPELGDDAMSFGTTVWRNLTNLGKAEFDGVDGLRVRLEDNSLEILCAGYVVRLYSLQGGIESIRWEGSEARLGGAVENSRDGQLAFDDEGQFPEVFAHVVPPKRHVRIAHTGDIVTGEAVAYLGLPRDNRDGGSPWFEVLLWFGEPAATGRTLPIVDGTLPAGEGGLPVIDGGLPGPRPDEMPIPELDLLALQPDAVGRQSAEVRPQSAEVRPLVPRPGRTAERSA